MASFQQLQMARSRSGRLLVPRRGLVVPDEPPSELHPNEPAGYTVIGEDNFSTLGTPQNADVDYNWKAVDQGHSRLFNASGHSIAPDPTGTYGDVWHYPLGIGHPCGSGNGTYHLSDQASSVWSFEASEFYEAMLFCMYGNGSEFEDQPGQQKTLGYWGVGESGDTNGNHVYNIMQGDPNHILRDGSRFSDTFRLQIRHQESGSFTRSPNQSHPDQYFHVGQWHLFETRMKLDSAPGAGDGELWVWKDGTLLMYHNDVPFRSSASFPRPFFARHFNQVYGGGCTGDYGTNKVQADKLLIKHMYISAKAA